MGLRATVSRIHESIATASATNDAAAALLAPMMMRMIFGAAITAFIVDTNAAPATESLWASLFRDRISIMLQYRRMFRISEQSSWKSVRQREVGRSIDVVTTVSSRPGVWKPHKER